MPGRPLDHRRPTGLTTFGPLLLRALSSGCAALSGIEAISDSVTAFLPVGWRNARRVLVVMVELLFSKFTQGAWLVVLTSPILVAVFLRIRAHSTAVARRLRMAPDVRLNLPDPPVSGGTPTVVLVGQRHRGRFEAIRFARSSASELVEVPVDLGTEKAERFQEPGEPQVPDVPLVILASPFRSLVDKKSNSYDSYNRFF